MIAGKSLDSISPEDIMWLCENAASESTTLEFKLTLPSANRDGKVGFLADVTALANTRGGDLIFGIQEEDSKAVAAPGVAAEGINETIHGLEQRMLHGVDPALPPQEFRAISIGPDKVALVVRVRPSWNAPHRVTVENHNAFYGRHSKGNFVMDVHQLREAFEARGSLESRMTEFLVERFHYLSNYSAIPRLAEAAYAAVHILPFSSFRSGARLDLRAHESVIRESLRVLPLHFYDFDGYCSSGVGPRPAIYTKLFRSGILEHGRAIGTRNGGQVDGLEIDRALRFALATYLPLLRNLGVQAPLGVSYALVSVHSCELKNVAISGREVPEDGHPADRANFQPTILLLNEFSDEKARLGKAFLDSIWNGFGYAECYLFDLDAWRF